MRPIFLVCLALISVSQAVFHMKRCSAANMPLAEYDRSVSGYKVKGYFEHYVAASPYYFATYVEVGTETPIESFGVSPGSDYLSRNQIPTSDDYRRINPTAFTYTDMVRMDYETEKNAGGPLLSAVDFGDDKTRYVSAVAKIKEAGGRTSLNWVRGTQWQDENACEYFSGSYYKIKCDPLWGFSNQVADYVLTGSDSDQFETGFGSGNPLTGIHTISGLSATWKSDLKATAAIEINLYYNLGNNDKIKIFDGPDSTTAASLANIVGPAVGTMTVKTTAFDFSASYSTASNTGKGFRAVYNVEGEYPCFSTGGPNQCTEKCYRDYICAWDGVSMSASLLQNFNYASCCDTKWGPECVLAADSIYWLQVCDTMLNAPYGSDNHNRDVKRDFVEEHMPHLNISQLHTQKVLFTQGPKA